MNATTKKNAGEETKGVSSVNTQGTSNRRGTTQLTRVQSGASALFRKSGLAAVILLGSLVAAQASQTALVSWNADSDSSVTGYKLNYGTSATNLSTVVNEGNVIAVSVPNLTVGQTYYFAASAYYANGATSLTATPVAFTATANPNADPGSHANPDPGANADPGPNPGRRQRRPLSPPQPRPRSRRRLRPLSPPQPPHRPRAGPHAYPNTDGTPTPAPTPYPAVTLFSATDAPKSVTQTYNDGTSLELGVKFQASSAGTVTGMRFYKAPANTSPHIGNLWSATGTLLASISSTGESASGWQQLNFSKPVAVTAGTTYVASYHTTLYSCDASYFTSALTKGPLTAPAGSNGVYIYASSSTFPSGSYESSNYWVDVSFQPTNAIQTPAAPILDAKVSTRSGHGERDDCNPGLLYHGTKRALAGLYLD